MMSRSCLLLVVAIAASVCCESVGAQSIVQSGSLSGSGSQTHSIVLDRFDTLGGTRQLTSVQLDYLTSTGGGYTTDGSGTSVHVISQLQVDYYRGNNPFGTTEALIDMVVQNAAGSPPLSVSVFDSDTDQVIITNPAALNPWTGTGTLTMTADVNFNVSENPPNVIFFGAGATIQYTLTYFHQPVTAVSFVRGDCNNDGSNNIADPIGLLSILFPQGPPPAPDCDDACDGNDDGALNIADAVALLGALFGNPAVPLLPPNPASGCGPDPSGGGGLDCAGFAHCP